MVNFSQFDNFLKALAIFEALFNNWILENTEPTLANFYAIVKFALL